MIQVSRKEEHELLSGEITLFLALIFILMISFTAALMESASIQSSKSYRRTDMGRALESCFAEYQEELLKEYDIFSLEGTYETGNYSEENLLNRIAYYGGANIDQDITKIQMLTDQSGRAFLDQIARYEEDKNILPLPAIENIWNPQQTENELQRILSQGNAKNDEASNMLAQGEGDISTVENPLPGLKKLQMTPLVSLVMPDKKSVSSKEISLGETVSHRALNKGRGDFSDKAEDKALSKPYMVDYLMAHFSSAADQSKGVSIKGETDEEIMEEAIKDAMKDKTNEAIDSLKNDKEEALDYQLEYILMGKSGDKANLEAVLRWLLGIRMIVNYAYIRQDSEKRTQAEAIAIPICTLAMVPEASDAMTEALLISWAFGESIMDLRSLMSGKKVPIGKTKDTWQLSWSALAKLGTNEDSGEGKGSSTGVTYKQYLGVFLLIESKNKASMRSLDMIELHMQKANGYDWFKADQCINKVEIHSTAQLRRGIQYQFTTYFGYR